MTTRAEELLAAEIGFSRVILAKQREVERLNHDGGDEILAAQLGDGDIQAVIRQQVDPEFELASLIRAVYSARAQRVQEIRNHYRVEAQQVLEEALQLEARADRRQKKLDKLLEKLENYEGCKYEPAAEVQGRRQLIHPNPGKTAELRLEAQEIRKESAEMAGREVKTCSAVGDSVDSLIEQIWSGAMMIGPAAHDIREWAQRVEVEARCGHQAMPHHFRARYYVRSDVNGDLDEGQSRCIFEQPRAA